MCPVSHSPEYVLMSLCVSMCAWVCVNVCVYVCHSPNVPSVSLHEFRCCHKLRRHHKEWNIDFFLVVICLVFILVVLHVCEKYSLESFVIPMLHKSHSLRSTKWIFLPLILLPFLLLLQLLFLAFYFLKKFISLKTFMTMKHQSKLANKVNKYERVNRIR